MTFELKNFNQGDSLKTLEQKVTELYEIKERRLR